MTRLQDRHRTHSDGTSPTAWTRGVVVARLRHTTTPSPSHLCNPSHIETFGPDAFDTDTPILDAFLAETSVAV